MTFSGIKYCTKNSTKFQIFSNRNVVIPIVCRKSHNFSNKGIPMNSSGLTGGADFVRSLLVRIGRRLVCVSFRLVLKKVDGEQICGRVSSCEVRLMNLLIRLFWFLLGWILCRKMDGEYIN